MASANLSGAPANLPGDERVRNVGTLRKLLARPEFGQEFTTFLNDLTAMQKAAQ